MRGLDWTMVKLKASEQRMEALAHIDSTAVGRLAYEVFGSADKVYAVFNGPTEHWLEGRPSAC